MSVVIETTAGDLTLDLFTEERPRTSLNFLKLCKIKYYNFCLFYTIERNFTARTGDPAGTGRGGESVFSIVYGDQAKYFEAETKPRLKHTQIGTVSMINNGDNMHGSQFFITLGEQLDFLDGHHTVFGQVVEGLDTLMKLNDTICDGENKPYQDICITHTVVLHDPYDDLPGLVVPSMSPEPTKEVLRSSRIGVHEEIDDTKGKSIEEIEEEIKDKEAQSRATILEMIGDIPEAEVKPPDNVLFVCKLNPVTTAEDLEVIFSRFGTILSCEVIKDHKTGESLQYAFIEFENPSECENAYFKMDNVLIDDRRIHVDFSQSVSKLNWQEMRKNAKNSFKNPQFKIKDSKYLQAKDPKYDLIFEDEKSNSKGETVECHKKSRHTHRQAESPRRSQKDVPHRRQSGSNSDLKRHRHSRSRSNDRDRHSKSRHHDSRKRRDSRRSPSLDRKSKKHHRRRSSSSDRSRKKHKREHKKHRH